VPALTSSSAAAATWIMVLNDRMVSSLVMSW
jgi:hypothetical protein